MAQKTIQIADKPTLDAIKTGVDALAASSGDNEKVYKDINFFVVDYSGIKKTYKDISGYTSPGKSYCDIEQDTPILEINGEGYLDGIWTIAFDEDYAIYGTIMVVVDDEIVINRTIIFTRLIKDVYHTSPFINLDMFPALGTSALTTMGVGIQCPIPWYIKKAYNAVDISGNFERPTLYMPNSEYVKLNHSVDASLTTLVFNGAIEFKKNLKIYVARCSNNMNNTNGYKVQVFTAYRLKE